MKKETIKEIGVINIDAIEVAEGCIEMRIPVEIVSQQLDNKLDKLIADFEKTILMLQRETLHMRLEWYFRSIVTILNLL